MGEGILNRLSTRLLNTTAKAIKVKQQPGDTVRIATAPGRPPPHYNECTINYNEALRGAGFDWSSHRIVPRPMSIPSVGNDSLFVCCPLFFRLSCSSLTQSLSISLLYHYFSLSATPSAHYPHRHYPAPLSPAPPRPELTPPALPTGAAAKRRLSRSLVASWCQQQ